MPQTSAVRRNCEDNGDYIVWIQANRCSENPEPNGQKLTPRSKGILTNTPAPLEGERVLTLLLMGVRTL